ncbi:unnamed protein product [Meloidogyne enterolobii]|uniref:Uncharacterized protein n=1 Tax=Meloidogyne enterolobii TaxID=390850 RepID=A0ACB0ZNG0_MELEN
MLQNFLQHQQQQNSQHSSQQRIENNTESQQQQQLDEFIIDEILSLEGEQQANNRQVIIIQVYKIKIRVTSL